MPLDPTARVLIDAMEQTFPPLDPTLSGTEMRALVEQAGARMPRGDTPSHRDTGHAYYLRHEIAAFVRAS